MPVTTAGLKPHLRLYWSKIQLMTCAFVFMSGAGMSVCGPMTPEIASTNLRVRRCSSLADSFVGSHWMPPFAPPNGTPTTAVFQVIKLASERTSSISTDGWNLRPPLNGPRESSCWTRYPMKFASEPSSRRMFSSTRTSRAGVSKSVR